MESGAWSEAGLDDGLAIIEAGQGVRARADNQARSGSMMPPPPSTALACSAIPPPPRTSLSGSVIPPPPKTALTSCSAIPPPPVTALDCSAVPPPPEVTLPTCSAIPPPPSTALARTAMAEGPRGEQDDGDQGTDPQQRPDHVRGRDGDEDDQRDEQDRVAASAARLARRVRRCRSPCFRQVVEQAVQVGAGLGAHGPADTLVELGLVKTAGAEVLGQAVGDRLPLGVGNPHVLV